MFERYNRLIEKLFGGMGDRLTNTFSEDWETRDVGFIGKLDGRITRLERQLKELKLKKGEGGKEYV